MHLGLLFSGVGCSFLFLDLVLFFVLTEVGGGLTFYLADVGLDFFVVLGGRCSG